MEKEVRGNINGVRQSLLDEIGRLYDFTLSREEFVSEEMVHALETYTKKLGREIAVVISRDGRVLDVSIGDDQSAQFASLRLTRSEKRLSGARCIHTHPNGSAKLSDVDRGSLLHNRLDAMCAIAVSEAKPPLIVAGFLGEKNGEQWEILTLGPVRFSQLDQSEWMLAIAQAEAYTLADDSYLRIEEEAEKAVLIAVENGREREDHLEELALLAETAGAKVVACERQKRDRPDTATYIGKGKLFDLIQLGSAQNVDLFIFDDELSPVQIRNLESVLGQRVIDRTALILDIFASRAQSREGKLQVELAQLKYRLPRLIGSRDSLSRLGGGIGTRGPGEKKLETDRRRIRRQIFELEREIEQVAKQRELRRMRRKKNAIPQIALVGYTNAGKSTLLNALTDSDVLAKDMLFATLDPVTRNVLWEEVGDVLISDTVGFIDKLPHDLVDAFRSTLEEVTQADVIVHVVDISAPNYSEQMDVVQDVLDALQAGDTPTMIAYNKIDRCGALEKRNQHDAVYISARQGIGIEELIGAIANRVSKGFKKIQIKIAYDKMEAVAYLRNHAVVLDEEYADDGVMISARVNEVVYGMVQKWMKEEGGE